MPGIIVILLSPLFITSVTHFLFNKKEKELIEYQEKRNKILEHGIVTQLSSFKFDCGVQDIAILNSPTYYGRHIRIAGLHLAMGRGCSTMGSDLPILKHLELSNTSPASFNFTTINHAPNAEPELVIYSKKGNRIAYWVINSSWAHEFLDSPCKNCFYLEFNYKNPVLHNLKLPRGNAKIKNQLATIEKSTFDSAWQVEQILSSGIELHNYAKKQTMLYSIIIAITLSFILTILKLLFEKYNSSLKGLLKTALENREFIPFYQAIVDIEKNEIIGYEALIRWRKNGEFIAPSAFIDYAEDSGLIIPMTMQLIEHVVADLKYIPEPRWISVNLVATHVEQSHLEDMLSKLKWPSPERLTFELTERIPILNITRARLEIAKLQLRGYNFKIDDFGTGYGGFSYLQRLGIKSIKIDKMFIDTIETHDIKRNVLDAIIAFGHESKMEMIAEGVENLMQVEYLAKQGVNLIQGYVFSRPQPFSEVLKLKHPKDNVIQK
ncbi:TPA: EAL domain-containing protein [Aeromonas dhakensis]|nr:EAL domain-containing protein [Aeromonas dhakensis]